MTVQQPYYPVDDVIAAVKAIDSGVDQVLLNTLQIMAKSASHAAAVCNMTNTARATTTFIEYLVYTKNDWDQKHPNASTDEKTLFGGKWEKAQGEFIRMLVYHLDKCG